MNGGWTGKMRATRRAPGAIVALLAAGLALAGCSNQTEQGPSGFDIARQALGQMGAAAGIGGGGAAATEAAAAAAADTPDAMAARALQANPGPLILVGLEGMGSTQVLAQVGQNGDMRTYMTTNKQALIIRGGMLTGTKGLGHDLSVADAPVMAGLIRARRAGSGERVMRYITGDGVERPLPLSCTTALGETKSFPFAGRNWTATQVQEDCRGHGVTVQNSYLVTADGQIPVSRQWVGPQLGYMTIQVIRP